MQIAATIVCAVIPGRSLLDKKSEPAREKSKVKTACKLWLEHVKKEGENIRVCEKWAGFIKTEQYSTEKNLALGSKVGLERISSKNKTFNDNVTTYSVYDNTVVKKTRTISTEHCWREKLWLSFFLTKSFQSDRVVWSAFVYLPQEGGNWVSKDVSSKGLKPFYGYLKTKFIPLIALRKVNTLSAIKALNVLKK